MKRKIKAITLALAGLLAVVLLTGCGNTETPYETNNKDNYTVSVKYDANGGIFTTNTYVIVDSYNIKGMEKNENGLVEIALLSPDNESRGTDAFSATLKDHFLAGWYQNRTEITDENGKTTYTYSDKWDFESSVLELDPVKEYSADDPVITLYAAWVPLYSIEFYSIDSGELLDTYVYDPGAGESLSVPAWDKEKGTVEMFKFPERKGYTFNNVYYDAEGKNAVNAETVTHSGVIDYATGTAENTVMKLYIDWLEGDWYHIYNAEQLLDNANLSGHYIIENDLDFEGEAWPTVFMHGSFEGEIIGNGHTVKNVSVTQKNRGKMNAGMFGVITENASISDITFENVTFTIEGGARMVGTSFGLLAGTVSDGAGIENVKILGSTLQIDSKCYFETDDYAIGLVCGMGDHTLIPDAEITCIASGDEPEKIVVTTDGNEVNVEILN